MEKERETKKWRVGMKARERQRDGCSVMERAAQSGRGARLARLF